MQDVKDMVKPYTVTKTGSFADVIAMKYMGGTNKDLVHKIIFPKKTHVLRQQRQGQGVQEFWGDRLNCWCRIVSTLTLKYTASF